jgi:hypothetical protein
MGHPLLVLTAWASPDVRSSSQRANLKPERSTPGAALQALLARGLVIASAVLAHRVFAFPQVIA